MLLLKTFALFAVAAALTSCDAEQWIAGPSNGEKTPNFELIALSVVREIPDELQKFDIKCYAAPETLKLRSARMFRGFIYSDNKTLLFISSNHREEYFGRINGHWRAVISSNPKIFLTRHNASIYGITFSGREARCNPQILGGLDDRMKNLRNYVAIDRVIQVRSLH